MNPLRFLPEAWKERLRRRAGAVTPSGRLECLAAAGFSPRRIVDGGAYRGEWSRLARRVFPSAALLLFEPQPSRTAQLGALAGEIGRCCLRAAALGREAGRAALVMEESNSRLVGKPRGGGHVVEVEVETLDEALRQEGWNGCDLLKLDLQGHELEALAGAGETLRTTEVVQVEVSWIPIGPVPLAAEVITTLGAAGFRLYDVFGFNYRPLDRALWQTDFLFVRLGSPLVADLRWSS